jgi:hypothetical protein
MVVHCPGESRLTYFKLGGVVESHESSRSGIVELPPTGRISKLVNPFVLRRDLQTDGKIQYCIPGSTQVVKHPGRHMCMSDDG